MWPYYTHNNLMIGPWYSFASPFLSIFFVFLLIWIFIRIFGGHKHHGQDSALDILKKRYAKGEITKREFDEMREHIA